MDYNRLAKRILMAGYPAAAIIFVLCFIFWVPKVQTEAAFKSRITGYNRKSDITIEKYCGYLVSVGHGSMKFEDDKSLESAYLIFDNGKDKPRSVRILIGNEVGIQQITAGRYYQIYARRFDDGSGFPRTIDVVEHCE
jgi:hypothetical protein